jgi:hypothetical protein
MLPAGDDLEAIPFADLDSRKEPKISRGWQIGIAAAVAIVVTAVLFFSCDRISTYHAWVLIICTVGIICFLTSRWAERGKLRRLAEGIALCCGVTSLVALIVFWIWYA